ncbi:restriction endonuclease subunit S [Mesoflavibacter zeaxanthinifaciens]|uniref:restriction endonuclease subunit S n=1 Tax=Mesoflavibacter zeaxanthinifaciens TaxID=393060 RepID=UPI003A8ED2FA
MEIQKYSNYKDSGIDWLGVIPEHWENYRIDWVTNIVRGNTGLKKDELLEKGDYVALQYGKTYKVDEVNNDFQFYVNNELYKKSQVVNCGDTILISTSETLEDLGHSCFYNREDLGLLGGEQILLKPDGKQVNEKYLYYYSKFFCVELGKYATGLKVFRFNINDLKNTFILIPSIEEQIQIVNYLDAKINAIDKKIVLLNYKIKHYKSYRKTVINEAVSKGLVNDVSKWVSYRLKDIGFLYSGLSGKSGNDFNQDDNPNNRGFIPFTNIANNTYLDQEHLGKVVIQDNEKQNQVKQNDIFFLMSSEGYEDIGKSAVLKDDIKETYLNSFCKGFRITNKNCEASFINYLLLSDNYRQKMLVEGKGFTRINLKMEKVNNFSVLIPSTKKEQQQIVDYLDAKTTTIDTIVINIESQITALKELRKTLINEVVTGKVKVTA